MIKLQIDAGHGGRDSGALGENIKEKDVVLQISKYLEDYLPKDKFTIKQSRSTDVYVSLAERTNSANNWGASLFVSIHNNFFNKEASGIETFCNTGSVEGKAFATKVQKQLVDDFPDSENRGVKENRFYVLRATNMPAILVECEFIDSRSDYLRRADIQKKFAESIGRGILDYVGVKTETIKPDIVVPTEPTDKKSSSSIFIKFLNWLFNKK